MSLLNTANDGLPNVLALLFQTTAEAKGGLSEATLLERLQPEGAFGRDGKVAQTLRRWLELGLFEVKNNRVVISDAYREPKGFAYGSIEHCRIVARMAVFAQKNNERFWEAEESKAADLTRSLAWLLVQNVYTLDWKSLEDLESRQLTREDAKFARNDVRLNGLRIWASFLGFSWNDVGGLVIDPTLAIRNVIRDLVPEDQEFPMSQFLENLAKHFPVLDHGHYRCEVEANLDPGSYDRLPEYHLSTALSRALYRLRREQLIHFLNRSDSRSSYQLTGPGRASSAGDSVTHIALIRSA